MTSIIVTVQECAHRRLAEPGNWNGQRHPAHIWKCPHLWSPNNGLREHHAQARRYGYGRFILTFLIFIVAATKGMVVVLFSMPGQQLAVVGN